MVMFTRPGTASSSIFQHLTSSNSMELRFTPHNTPLGFPTGFPFEPTLVDNKGQLKISWRGCSGLFASPILTRVANEKVEMKPAFNI